MATYDFPIASDADDGKEVGGTVWNARSEDPYAGDAFFTIAQNNNALTNELGALRFAGVDINGETLDTATLSITISGVSSVDAAQSIIRVHGDDVDNCAALSVTHMPSVGWTNTTASVDQAGLSATTIDIDVTSIVAEIIARGGWADGNAIGFALRLAGTDTYWAVNVVDYDPDLLATRANLRIVTVSGGTVNTEQINDALTLSDSPQNVAYRSRTISDSMTLLAEDEVYRELNYMLSDSVDLTDSTILQRLRQRMIADSVTVAELVTALYVPEGSGGTVNTKQIDDAITIADAVTRLLFASRTVSDAVTLSDAQLLSSLYTREISDSMDMVDSTVLRLWWTKVLTDQMDAADSPIALYVPDVLYDIDIRLGSTIRGMPVLGGY